LQAAKHRDPLVCPIQHAGNAVEITDSDSVFQLRASLFRRQCQSQIWSAFRALSGGSAPRISGNMHSLKVCCPSGDQSAITATRLQPKRLKWAGTRWHGECESGSKSTALLDFWGSHSTAWDAIAQALNLARLPIPPLRLGGKPRVYRRHTRYGHARCDQTTSMTFG
jgi:hypothetical protein